MGPDEPILPFMEETSVELSFTDGELGGDGESRRPDPILPGPEELDEKDAESKLTPWDSDVAMLNVLDRFLEKITRVSFSTSEDINQEAAVVVIEQNYSNYLTQVNSLKMLNCFAIICFSSDEG